MIKASSSTRVNTLIADLGSDDLAVRDAAAAGLIILGPRAVERLAGLAAGDHAPRVARLGALRVLEAIADPRALDAALALLGDRDLDVVSAAIGVARSFLPGPRGLTVVDRLTSIALDRERAETIRVAAIRALGDLQASTLRPIVTALQDDPSDAIRDLAASRRAAAGRSDGLERLLDQAVAGTLPDEPSALRTALRADSGALSILDVKGLIERTREREREVRPGRRIEWMTVRAAAHAVLAHRGSRLALYDLRETIEGATAPLPVDFVAALVAVGDDSCLEAIAVAYTSAIAPGAADEDWWRRHLVDAFRAIVARERVTKRHAVVKRIEKRWPAALRGLWAGRTRQ